MGLKEKMADTWMGNVGPKEKREMMEGMMDDFFSQISADEKAKMMEAMMEKFMAGLSPEEKQKMMANMMPKMMSGMMGGKDSKESKTTDADQIGARFKLSKNSANYFLTRLSQQGNISLKAEKSADQ
jgi:hypothetical protein